VVAEADNGVGAVAAARQFQPDVVIMDVSLPAMNGADATKAILEGKPRTRVLAFSAHEELAFARMLLDAGASGYALKRSASDELVRATRIVAAGGTYLDPTLSAQLVRTSLRPKDGGAITPARLSERELEVIRLIAAGQTLKEIAEHLRVSARTVETYRARAMEKLCLKTRAELIRYAIQSDWLRGLPC
jgi:DNA-binding NarL/FixJ family response regulator